MTLRQFDIIFVIMFAFIVGFSVGVSTGWDWFPDPDDWGLIANITNKSDGLTFTSGEFFGRYVCDVEFQETKVDLRHQRGDVAVPTPS